MRVYAFGVPTTRLRVWCTPEALTNQGGKTHQYIDHVVCFDTEASHHPNKHTILHVFRARGYDSPVPLSWYKQINNLEIGNIFKDKAKENGVGVMDLINRTV